MLGKVLAEVCMPRNIFEKKLRLLNRELILMASECETMIAQASRHVLQGDRSMKDSMREEYQHLLERENTVSTLCQNLFVSQQPVASDCGFIITAMKMGIDLKAVGDYAMHIIDTTDFTWPNTLELENMAVQAIHLLTKSIDAFVQEDMQLAQRVVAARDESDADFIRIKKRLIERLKFKEMSEEQVIASIQIANDFCHIAHHASNIGQWVIDQQRKGAKI